MRVPFCGFDHERQCALVRIYFLFDLVKQQMFQAVSALNSAPYRPLESLRLLRPQALSDEATERDSRNPA